MVYFVLLGLFTIRASSVLGLLSRCLEQDMDNLTFQCPKKYVIYRPIINLGSNNQSTCVLLEDTCTGLTREMLFQKERCAWKRRCTVRWTTQAPLFAEGNAACSGQTPSFVAYDRPLCVKQSRIFSICSNTDDLGNYEQGIIRSHDDYPTTYESLRGQRCSLRLRTNRDEGLKLVIDDVDLSDGDHLTIKQKKRSAITNVQQIGHERNKTIFVDGDVIISLYVSKNDIPTGKGFIMRFERVKKYVSTGRHFEITDKRKLKRNKYLTTEGVIIEDINEKRSKVMVSCPEGHVIHDLEVKALASSKRKGYLYYRDKDCFGQYYSLITENNNCFWKRSCHVTKSPSQPMATTNELRCLPKIANQISTRRYQCSPRDNIFDICSHAKSINATRGLIKSHFNYPWHYSSKPRLCRKLIYVNPEVGLRLNTEHTDLDPGTRGDNLKIFFRQGGRKLVKKLVGSQMIDVRFPSGMVELIFRVSARSKGGQGFILKFEPLLQTGQKLDWTKTTTNLISGCGFTKKDHIRALLLKLGGRVVVPICDNLIFQNKGKLPSTTRRRRRKRKQKQKHFRRVRWAAINDWGQNL